VFSRCKKMVNRAFKFFFRPGPPKSQGQPCMQTAPSSNSRARRRRRTAQRPGRRAMALAPRRRDARRRHAPAVSTTSPLSSTCRSVQRRVHAHDDPDVATRVGDGHDHLAPERGAPVRDGERGRRACASASLSSGVPSRSTISYEI
jgi:hypothetical protein